MSKKKDKKSETTSLLLSSLDDRLASIERSTESLVAETQTVGEEIRGLRDDIKKIMETLTAKIEDRG